jgi:glycosyltransferase Alg8
VSGKKLVVEPIRKKPFEWQLGGVVAVYFQLLLALAWFLALPADISSVHIARLFAALGLLATWRYTWWFTHFVRSVIYEKRVFPRWRAQANELLDSGWRPDRVVFMMTTFREDEVTTQKVIVSIIREAKMLGTPVTLFVGTGDRYDEDIIAEQVERFGDEVPDDFRVVFIRQETSGKRIAIGLTLRAMAREGIGGDTPVVFLDGDSILDPGCIKSCVPFFKILPNMHALTTHEVPIIEGNQPMQKWFSMRFAQRNMAMQSHALSRRVLTLTGRLSVMRASLILDEEFISTVESDSLHHWHWGTFRFLSGDDKSTWYTLLKRGVEMIYVPDATVHTVEQIEDAWISRAGQNMLRWSGNMLRNGSRAIAIGPRKMGFFIWWCLIDQRIAMWTCLAGPIALITGSALWTPVVLLALPPWIILTRGTLAMFLYYHNRKIDPWFPLILYLNQIISSVLKIYILFRLPMQRWANRSDQRAITKIDWGMKRKMWIANGMTIIWCAVFVIAVMYSCGLATTPLRVHMVNFLDFLL